MTQVTEDMIPVTGGNVWYRRVGEGTGTPLLVLHGGPGGSAMDEDVLFELGSERPVIYYDQLGGGRSDRPSDPSLWTVERFVEELGQVRAALGLDEVHLLGHSWGTMLAAAYLLGWEPGSTTDGSVEGADLSSHKVPAGVRSVIFSSPCLSAPAWERDQRAYLREFPLELQEIVERHERAGTTDAEEYQDAMTRFYQRHVCRLDPWPQTVVDGFARSSHAVYGLMWGASEFTVTGTLKHFDVTGRLPELHLPALFTCGRYDEATPATTEHYARLVSGAGFHVFENSGHMPPVEEPQAYLRVVRDFIARVEGDSSVSS